MAKNGALASVGLVLLLLLSLPPRNIVARHYNHARKLHRLVGSNFNVPILMYHGGPLLTKPSLPLHLLWYGSFSSSQQSAITDFIASFQAPSGSSPSVASWWANTITLYQDTSRSPCASDLRLGTIASDTSYRQGKSLTKAQISAVLEQAIADGALPQQVGASIYIVFTASDVLVEDFCMSSCGYHSTTSSGDIAFIWVGNAATQCLGLCAWPFAIPPYGPHQGGALRPPSGEAATDGMIINLATLLAGTVTNPYGNGYFPNPLDDNDSGRDGGGGEAEAASACPGMFGSGSYPGYPGNLPVDKASGATYNCRGVNDRLFLLPALWSPNTQRCEPPV